MALSVWRSPGLSEPRSRGTLQRLVGFNGRLDLRGPLGSVFFVKVLVSEKSRRRLQQPEHRFQYSRWWPFGQSRIKMRIPHGKLQQDTRWSLVGLRCVQEPIELREVSGKDCRHDGVLSGNERTGVRFVEKLVCRAGRNRYLVAFAECALLAVHDERESSFRDLERFVETHMNVCRRTFRMRVDFGFQNSPTVLDSDNRLPVPLEVAREAVSRFETLVRDALGYCELLHFPVDLGGRLILG